MSRHPDFVPQGVIPAVLLPFHEDLSIDEASFRAHLRDVGSVQGLSAITINAHSTEVASCTGGRAAPRHGDRRRGSRRHAADHSRCLGGRQSGGGADRPSGEAGGASALLVFPPAPFTLGQSPGDGAGSFQDHRRCDRSAADRVSVSAGHGAGLSGGDAGAAFRRSADHPRHQGLDAAGTAAREHRSARCRAASVRSTCCPPTAPGC